LGKWFIKSSNIGEGLLRRVALIYEARHAYDWKFMAGVAAYIHENPGFNVYLERDALKDQRLPDFHSWQGHGIIANFDHPNVAAAVSRSGLPVVGFGSGYGWRAPSIPYFFTNNRSIAQMAADHFLFRGFQNFAFCGYQKDPINGWSEERERNFVAYIKARGYACPVYVGPQRTTSQWAAVERAIVEWLTPLRKPVAVMAANDSRALDVLEACRASELRVPEEVAVVGVNNDQVLCELGSPPLTSIEHGTERMGYEAAALLERMMNGEKPRRRRFVIDPVGITTRRSSDVLAIEDRAVANAMAFIQVYATKGIKVADVTKALGISRSGLEARFDKALSYSVHTAIRRTQMERARTLVSDTKMPLKQIAANTGFRSVQQMTTLFRKTFLQPPAKYRKNLTRTN
jgi:LacI family transcriptional regulator